MNEEQQPKPKRKHRIDAGEALSIGLACLKVGGDVSMLADGVDDGELDQILADLDEVRRRVVAARKD